jgi:chemotaxis family two-component system response regulator Rcp1
MQPDRFLPGTPAQILLVEDNPGDIRLMQEAFREGRFAWTLHITRDGEQAMAFLHHEKPYLNSPCPALILLDLNLPRKDGREVLAQIKQDENLRRIPVMVLSTSTRAEDIDKAYDLHANCYVTKPVDIEGLVELGRLIERFWLSGAVLAS